MEKVSNTKSTEDSISEDLLLKAFKLMCTAKSMTELFEENAAVTSKYVHATSRGHEAVQIALGIQLLPQDYLSAYYRDDSILLSIGMKPYELMLQLMAKRDDPFSGGRSYYSHPSLNRDDMPKIPHQSSATGMQAIPTTGLAMGIQYLEGQHLSDSSLKDKPIVVCSLGDASMTEGEVSEALHMASLKELPILYLVQDNEWDISAHAREIRKQNAFEYVMGFKGIEAKSINGNDFLESYETLNWAIDKIRKDRKPILIHAKVPLLSHHTSGVRMEWYREDLDEHKSRDPFPLFRKQLLDQGIKDSTLSEIEQSAVKTVGEDYNRALEAEDPKPEDLFNFDFAPTPVTEESGIRAPEGKEATVMVDCALFAMKELMAKHPECLLYGQDVGKRLGGVFREAATLAETFGDERVFNTPIQEAFIVGSTVGMSVSGCKPVVEIQFADYIWPGLNQLFTEVSRSFYLSNGKWPVSCIIRIPIGAYGSGGPYHSSSVETVVLNIRGVKVAYPSTGADLKGLLKSAYYDPNPVVMFEHKGLYWSKIAGTEGAKTIEPDEDYIIPFGKARMVREAESGDAPSITAITYGMGVYWALGAAKEIDANIEIIDLRTLNPLDYNAVFQSAKKHGRCLVITEEPAENSFAQGLAGKIQDECFQYLDAPVRVIGSENLPAIPLNSILEKTMIPSADKVAKAMESLLNY
ncbi:MAG TPA: tungsten formylmethanofuran dehydrogenase [Flavobacteriales bacterium]|nr:tungsten formylmethanofuran dehydrogenase [Flavobacteriales bacterium]